MKKNRYILLEFLLYSITGAAFVALKITKVVAWSWWWVFSPYLLIAAIITAAMINLKTKGK